MSKLFKSEGIVFKSLKYSETSLILDIYTQEKGLQSFIVSGVRKAKSRFSNIYHPMNILNLVAYNTNAKLSRIKEGSISINLNLLSQSVIKASIGMFVIDLARNSIKEREVNNELYQFLKSQLLLLNEADTDVRFFALNFATQLAQYLGFGITNNYTLDNKYFDLESCQFIEDNHTNKSIIGEQLSLDFHNFLGFQNLDSISKAVRNDLLDKMMIFYAFHVEGFQGLKSLSVLRTILN